MDAARADTDRLRQFALGHFGVILKQAQDAEVHILAEFVTLRRHGIWTFARAVTQERTMVPQGLWFKIRNEIARLL